VNSDFGKGGCQRHGSRGRVQSRLPRIKLQIELKWQECSLCYLLEHPISISEAFATAVVDIYYYEAQMVWCVQSSNLLEPISYSLAKSVWRPVGPGWAEEARDVIDFETLELGALRCWYCVSSTGVLSQDI